MSNGAKARLRRYQYIDVEKKKKLDPSERSARTYCLHSDGSGTERTRADRRKKEDEEASNKKKDPRNREEPGRRARDKRGRP